MHALYEIICALSEIICMRCLKLYACAVRKYMRALFEIIADTQLYDNPDSALNSFELIRGNVANISIFSLPSLNKHAPLGLSQFTHLHDGWLDLVVVKNIENNSESKQFVKFIRRLGGRKNQVSINPCTRGSTETISFLPRGKFRLIQTS